MLELSLSFSRKIQDAADYSIISILAMLKLELTSSTLCSVESDSPKYEPNGSALGPGGRFEFDGLAKRYRHTSRHESARAAAAMYTRSIPSGLGTLAKQYIHEIP